MLRRIRRLQFRLTLSLRYVLLWVRALGRREAATGAPSLPTLPLVDRVHEDEEQTPRLRQVGYHSA